jgi:hypothetical protein
MPWLGHSSPAALLYKHAADDRDAEIVRALDATLRLLRGRYTKRPTQGRPIRPANSS